MAHRERREKGSTRDSRHGLADARSSKIRMSVTSLSSSRSSRASRSSRLGQSRRTFAQSEAANQPAVVVRDAQGNDVTPLGLLNLKPSVLKGAMSIGSNQPSGMVSGQLSPQSESSEFHERMSSTNFSRSGFSSGSVTPGDDGSNPVMDEGEEGDEPPVKKEKVMPEEDRPIPTEADLEKVVRLKFVETETVWLLDLPGSRVGVDYENVEQVKKSNEEYAAKLKARIGNDKFVDRAMQSLNGAKKMKESQATPAQMIDVGCTATNWDISDSLAALDVDTSDAWNPDDIMQQRRQKEQEAADKVVSAMASHGGEEMSESATQAEGVEGVEGGQARVPFMQSPAFEATLRYMERMVTQNVYHDRQLVYRNLEVEAGRVREEATNTDDDAAPAAATTTAVPDPSVSTTPPPAEVAPGTLQPHLPLKEEILPTVSQLRSGLTKLWTFSCDISKGRNISATCWNKTKKDILAVAYGQFEFSAQRDGLVLIWSLKNPEYPERVYHLKCGVTALDFSIKSPNLLAVGLYDGTVAIFDIKKGDLVPSLECSHTSGKHSDAVWEVRWVDKGVERGEMIVSISTDGRVTQWSIKKGLEHTNLMKLKRVTGSGKSGPTGKGDAFISRMASGLCFDFSPADSNIYLAATEDGNIHKCSCSYNEQYLDNYFGHAGPVYKVRWSPFNSDVFLSCSADWTIKAWQQDQDTPLLSLQSCTDYVADVVWSPNVSTMFGSVTGDGRIDIWDLSISLLDPVVTYKVDKKPSSILFSLNSPVVIVGSDDGSVDVYRLGGVDTSTYTPQEQHMRLERALAAKDALAEAEQAATQ